MNKKILKYSLIALLVGILAFIVIMRIQTLKRLEAAKEKIINDALSSLNEEIATYAKEFDSYLADKVYGNQVHPEKVYGNKEYIDKYIEIEFAGCRKGTGDNEGYYYADFNITNKTDTILQFIPNEFSFDGTSCSLFGIDEIEPQSTAKISFYIHKDTLQNTQFPTGDVDTTSGRVMVFDSTKTAFDNLFYYASWENVTQSK